MGRLTCAAALLCAAWAGGCAAPYVRAAGAAGKGHAGAQSYKVPANWDYRKHYKVPAERLKTIIGKYLGVPYRWGGASRRGMDCSGFVKVVFAELNHARLPRSSRAMSRLGRAVTVKTGRPGDLVFFRGGALKRINHVGIYVGGTNFAHVSRKKGVTYSSLDSEYYRKHFAGMRRIF